MSKIVVIHGSPYSNNIYKGGKTYRFGFSLGEVPTGNVTVTLGSLDSKFTLSATEFTFTTSNWYTPQYVTLTAVNDGVADKLYLDKLTISATGGGFNYTAQEKVIICDHATPERTTRKGTGISDEYSIRSQSEASSIRTAMIDFWTNGNGLPVSFTPDTITAGYTGSIHDAGVHSDFTYSTLTRYTYVLTDEDAETHTLYFYHFISNTSNGELVITSQGHGPTQDDIAIQTLLDAGYDVLHCAPPLCGDNTTTNPAVTQSADDVADHISLKNIASSTYDPIELYMVPVYKASKYLGSQGYTTRSVAGISGGGVTCLVSIFDTDIQKTFFNRSYDPTYFSIRDGKALSSFCYEGFQATNSSTRLAAFMADKPLGLLYQLCASGGREVYAMWHTQDTANTWYYAIAQIEDALPKLSGYVGGTIEGIKDNDASRATHQWYEFNVNQLISKL